MTSAGAEGRVEQTEMDDSSSNGSGPANGDGGGGRSVGVDNVGFVDIEGSGSTQG